MSSLVTDTILEKKFTSVSNTQDSIQTLSLWLLHHKAHHQKIVNTWLKVLKKGKTSHRLTLFYLANDVIQNCKRKNVSYFKDSFAAVLRDATLLVRDEQIRRNVDRVFKIWEERNVYDSDFIADLQGILANAKVPSAAASKLIAEFKCEKVIEKIRLVKKLEMEISTKLATLNLSKLNATNAEIVQKLKDRKHGQQFSREFDDNARCLEELVKSLEKEKEQRSELILLLEQSEIYYDNQRGEAKIVANAYKNFGTRVKALQKKLEEIMSNLTSPVPSPCPDAPSPTNSDVEAELNLPGEKAQASDSEPEMSAESQMSSSSKAMTSTVGNPIPTVSNIFNQEPGNMTSWLDTFTKKSTSSIACTTTTSASSKDTGSLDSRLSNLLQNIPNLPSGLQSTLFGTSVMENSPSESATDSPISHRKGGGSNTFHNVDALTPVKDEYSGQNTPLQDEDTPSSSATFFTRLAAAPKASRSPKEILKGLKDIIQNASSISGDKPHSLHDSSLSWPSDKSEPNEKTDTSHTAKKISSFSNLPLSFSSTSSVFESCPPPTTVQITSQVATNSSQVTFSQPVSYTSKQSSETSVSQSIHQNLSFIPTLVPSTPTGSNFNFGSRSSFAEYSPDEENFDMDIDSGDDANAVLSDPPTDAVSPEKSNDEDDDDDDDEDIGVPRQSTLITLVTDNGTSDTVLTKNNAIAPISFSESDRYQSSLENTYSVQKNEWPLTPEPVLPPINLPMPETKEVVIPPNCEDQESLNEAFFLSTPPPPVETSFPNGKRSIEIDSGNDNLALSKIQTVQSHRTGDENWNREPWNELQYNRLEPPDVQIPYTQRPLEYHDYQHKREYGGPRFPPPHNWQDQYRPPGPNFNRGPRPKRFSPYLPPRRRPWNRHPQHY